MFLFSVFLLLIADCQSLYEGDKCMLGEKRGTCKQLLECEGLMAEIRLAGSPLPREMSKRLNMLTCGFVDKSPLVCCKETDRESLADDPFNSLNNINNDGTPTAHFPNTNFPSNNPWSTEPNNNRKKVTNWWEATQLEPTPQPLSSNWFGSNQRTTPKVYPQVNPSNTNNHHSFENEAHETKTESNKWGPLQSTTNFITDDDNKLNKIDPRFERHRNFDVLPKNCGNVDEDRIIGGNSTGLFDMPWMVLLDFGTNREIICGGTLITKWHVLTAAHCVTNLGSKRLRRVILGEHNLSTDPDCENFNNEYLCAPRSRKVSIDSVTPHPGYGKQTLLDDIALIRLSEPADLSSESIMPICLPLTKKMQTDNLNDVKAIVAGWGTYEEGPTSNVLLKVKVPIIKNSDCHAYFKGNPNITDRQMCAGGVSGQDSCAGDSGGPLSYPGLFENTGLRQVQRGIVSFGAKKCGIQGHPAVYTKVASYIEWILDNIGD